VNILFCKNDTVVFIFLQNRINEISCGQFEPNVCFLHRQDESDLDADREIVHFLDYRSTKIIHVSLGDAN